MKRLFLSFSFILIFFLTACEGKTAATPTPDINAIYTTAAETVIAELTQSAAMNTATPPATATDAFSLPTATLVPTSAVTSTPLITDTPTPSPTLTPVPSPTKEFCDDAEFVADISVPDLTEMTPGQNFEKTWLIKNTGTCAWGEGYHLVFGYDEKMNGQARPLPSIVQPGEEVEMTVVLTAPTKAGEYRSYWRMANKAGVNFGDFFYVYIVVR